MRLLVDEQLPADLATWFSQRGHTAAHVRDVGMLSTPDGRILDAALTPATVIVTKDRDYNKQRRERRDGPQVLWLRAPNLSTADLLAFVDGVWSDVESHLNAGAAIVGVDRDGSVWSWSGELRIERP